MTDIIYMYVAVVNGTIDYVFKTEYAAKEFAARHPDWDIQIIKTMLRE